MATVHEGNKLFDAQSVKGNIGNNNNVIRDAVNTGSQQSGSNALRSDVEGGITLNNTTIEQNGLLGNDNESYRIVVIDSQDIRFPVSDSGYIEDGTGENPLRPVVYDGDIISIYTIRGAVTALIINVDNTYNKEVYDILYKLDLSSIMPHISITDLNISGSIRMVAINAVRDNDDILVWYVKDNDITGNYDIYRVVLHPDGTCEREHNNVDNSFYKVGKDGYLWVWDSETNKYVSTERPIYIQYARELLDADDLSYVNPDEGIDIEIDDPGTTGTVLWGAESANQVALSVNGVSKLLLKKAAIDGALSRIGLLEGGVQSLNIRVANIEETSFDSQKMWELLTAGTSEQINISHIPDITVSKVTNIENWIESKGYITKSVNDLINYYAKNQTYTKTEVDNLIGSLTQFEFRILPELPAVGQTNILYLIGPRGDTDVYDEYVYSNNTWTKIGSTSIDLSGYVQNTRIISVGDGIVGGGDLSADRIISLSQNTIASLALADTALQPSDIDGYVNDIVTGQGNYISGVSKNGKVLTFAYGTLPTTIALSNVTGAEDLQAIEALSGAGFLKRIGDNSWSIDTNTYALSSDLLAVGNRVTTLESRVNWDDIFEIDEYGDVHVKHKTVDGSEVGRNLYTEGNVSAGGLTSEGGGSSIDLERVWESLTNNTDYPDVKINITHIPTIPYSNISGTPTIIDRARNLLDGNDLCYVDTDEGEEITIIDDGRTGTVLWGAESANQVSLSVNGTSKLLLKAASLNGINSSITTLLGYFSSGSARNALALENHRASYFATASGLTAIDTRVTALENAAFDPTEMWGLLGAATNEQINLSHIPDFTTAKISNLESWITSKAYITAEAIPTNVSAFNNDAGYLTQHQSLANYYTKGEVDSEIGALRDISITGTGYLTGGGTLAQNRTIDISQQVKTKIDNGSTAYGWGDHSTAGYFLSDNFTKQNIKLTLDISDWALSKTKPQYSYDEITGLPAKLSDIEGDITSATGRIQSIEDWFTNPSLDNLTVTSPINADITGNSATASRLNGNGVYTAWGRTYWRNGVPESISGAIENATTINASGAITLSGTNNTSRRIYFGDTNHYLELDEYGFHFSHGIYSEDFVTAKGINSTGGGGDIDLERVWESLANNTDFPDEKINISHIPTIPWANLSGTPTTIAGYGIGDAKIENGVITLGDNTITPLTQHQSLDAYVNAAGYNSTLKQIELKHGSTVVATVDATAFIKDGMVSNVTISGGYLVISFNTDSGKEDIRIPISDIFDASNYYTKSDADGLFLLKTNFTKANIGLGDVDNLAASAYFTLLENDNNQLSITVGGTNKKLTVDYASQAGNASTLENHAASYFATASALSAVSGRVTTLENRQNWDDIFGIDANGDVYVKLDGNRNRNFYAYGNVSAGGLNSEGGGSSIDLARVWESLTNNTDFPDEKINLAHIPTIPYSNISGTPTIIDSARNLLDGDDLCYVDPEEGEEITIDDPGTTGTVLWGAESANQVSLSVNGVSKLLLKAASIEGITSRLGILEGYFSGGVARNAAQLNGHSDSYFATTSALNALANQPATESTLGLIKIGAGLAINDGVVSVTGQTQGTVTRVDVGSTQYNPNTDGVVSLPAYPTTLPASDVSAWAKASSLAVDSVPSLPWSKITSGTPTTLAGYGITDAKFSSAGVSDKIRITLGSNYHDVLTAHQSLSGYATESWVGQQGFITKAVNDLTNYYLKSDTYTKAEVEALIAAINQFHYEIAASTSDVSDPQGNVLYLIGPTGSGSDRYEEYVYTTTWVKIGDTSIDLGGYVNSVVASGSGNYISGFSKSGNTLTLNMATLPTTISLLNVTDADDLKAIEALTGTSGLLKKTAANTWTLDTSAYITGIDAGMVNTALGYTPFNAAYFTQSNIKNTLGISDWALDSSLAFGSLPDMYIGNTRVQSSPQTAQDLGGIRYLTTQRVYLGDGVYFYYDSNNGGVKLEGAGFYTDSFISGGGLNSNSGGGNIDLDRVWESLTNNTDKPNVKIDVAHIPDITVSKVSNIESWILSKGYITSSAIPTNVSDFNNDAGYLTDYTIYALTIKNSAGANVLTYNPKTAAGEISLSKTMIGLGNVENTALSTWGGSQNINTLGTVTTGVWHGSAVANEYLALDMSWALVRASATYDTEDYIHAN